MRLEDEPTVRPVDELPVLAVVETDGTFEQDDLDERSLLAGLHGWPKRMGRDLAPG